MPEPFSEFAIRHSAFASRVGTTHRRCGMSFRQAPFFVRRLRMGLVMQIAIGIFFGLSGFMMFWTFFPFGGMW
jgi:hypothetical protein